MAAAAWQLCRQFQKPNNTPLPWTWSENWSGHEAVARTARSVFALADAADDQPSADLLTQRLQVHEKTAWMLRSLLES